MNSHSINWNLSGLAGHDKHGNEISVRELVMALEGYEAIEKIANMSESMRDALAQQAAENYRIKQQNEHLNKQMAALEAQLNSAYAQVSNLLSEHADIQHSAAL